MEHLVIQIDSLPKGQPRMQHTVVAGHAHGFTKPTAEGWRQDVRDAARKANNFPKVTHDGPILVDRYYFLPLPRSLEKAARVWYQCTDPDLKRHFVGQGLPVPSKPDIDNLDKSTLDALASIGLWRDDYLICGGDHRKTYTVPHDLPCTARLSSHKPGALLIVRLFTFEEFGVKAPKRGDAPAAKKAAPVVKASLFDAPAPVVKPRRQAGDMMVGDETGVY